MRLVELQSTLDAGIHHRDNVFNSIGYNLEKWAVMVRHIVDHMDIPTSFFTCSLNILNPKVLVLNPKVQR